MNFERKVTNKMDQFLALGSKIRNRLSLSQRIAVGSAVSSLLFCSVLLFSQTNPSPQPAQPSGSNSSSANILTDAQMSKMTSDELAHYVFEHHGCNNCHTLGANGKLGFTERGKQVGKGFEGCISLLTSMNVIAQVKPLDRSAEEKQKAQRFQEFGCTTCHQITPGKLGLTSYGTKLKSLHMACTDVEKTLAQAH